MRTQRMVCSRNAVLVIVLVVVAGRAVAEPPRAPGSNTGDGSTPFTGLAHAPEANLFVGAATTAIPIEVPPGRADLTPVLALTYNSGAGPSPYGYGWDLLLGKIQRCTKHGVLSCTDPRYRNDFVLVLPGATVECTLDPHSNRCHPVVEESFLRIQYDPSANAWDVWDKGGVHYIFGEDERDRAGNNVSSLFASGIPCSYTFAWALSWIEDPNGNYLEIVNTKDDGLIHPEWVRYGGNRNAGPDHPFDIEFVWSDEDGFSRPLGDEILNNIGGFPARLTKLLSRISVRFQYRPVRSYQLHYDFHTATSRDDRFGRQSFLSAVTLHDGDGRALARADGLPAATTFRYHDNSIGWGGFETQPQVRTRPAFRLPLNGETVTLQNALRWTDRDDGTRRDVLDMNGDGFADLVDAWPIHDRHDGCSNSTAVDYWDVYLGSAAGFDSTPIRWYVPLRGAMCDIRRGRPTITWRDTFDITGDGIPDFVDANVVPWQIYPGTAHSPYSPTNEWGFGPAQSWAAPLPNTQVVTSDLVLEPPTDPDASGGRWRGNGVRQDMLDMNGDGLPDLVQAPGLAGGVAWRVWFNTGSGFGVEESVAGAFNFIAFLSDDGGTVAGTFDINGDGLPDTVLSQPTSGGAYTGHWEVWINRGHAIDWYEEWELPGVGWYRHIRKTSGGPLDTVRDLIDMNGDGLPDVVDTAGWRRENPVWQVFLNRGGGFGQEAMQWGAPLPHIRNGSDGGGRTLYDTFVADGDGLLDLVDFRPNPYSVYHNMGGAWCASADGRSCGQGGAAVAVNVFGGRPDLLEQMENGIGGVTELRYRPSTQWNNTDANGVPRLPFVLWTVTRIIRDDGLCYDLGSGCVGSEDTGHFLKTDLQYAYGLFDPVSREFRGFRTVKQYDAEGNGRTTFFHQDAVRKGRVEASNRTNPANRLLAYAYNFWECVDPADGATRSCEQTLAPGQRRWARVRQRDRYAITNHAPSRRSLVRNAAWDAYGNVTHAITGGSGTSSVHTHTRYATRDDASGYIVDRPTHLRLEGGGTMRERWFVYDDLSLGQVRRGNLTQVHSWLDQVIDPALPEGDPCPQSPASGIGTCVTTTMAYDARGNLTAVTDANGNRTTTAYDGVTEIYPYTVTNARQQEVASRYDPACGTLLWQTVTYPAAQEPTAQARAEQAYDTFCRLHATALPDQTVEQPHREYLYFLGTRRQATVVQTREVVAGTPLMPNGWVVSDDLFDALGRHIQTQRDAVVDGRQTTVAAMTVTFDTRGNPVARYAPFAMQRSDDNGAARYAPPPPATGVTRLAYDGLNRVTQVTDPAGYRRTFEHNVAWQSTTKDECYNDNCPHGGGRIVEKRDAFGRVIEKQMYEGDRFVSRVGYAYDGLGRLRTTTQGTTPTSWAPSTTIEITSDSLGRRIQLDDPDSGTWRYGYDRVGNLIYQDDPKRDQHVSFCYDALGRVTDKFYHSSRDRPGPRHCGTFRGQIAYHYDAGDGAALGRLTSVTDQSGSTSWTYDVRGRTVSVLKSITADSITTSGRTSYVYDIADHITTMTYPDGEVVRYRYDPAGQVTSVAGSNLYVQQLTYDLLGRPRSIVHGNRTVDTWTYHGATDTFRLASIETMRGSTPLLAYSYAEYSPTGLLTRIADNGPKGMFDNLDNSATLLYDGLGRLTGVDGVNLPYRNGYAYGALGNMTRKEGTALGYSATRPHTLTEINGSSAGVAHDTNGNRRAAGGDTYAYDQDDRLVEINGGMVRFVYDYAGRRVAKIGGTSVTRYYGRWAEAADGYLTKYYFAAGMPVASQRVPNALLAGVRLDPGVPAARVVSTNPAAVPGRDLGQPAFLLLVAAIGSGLVLAPWRRRRVAGFAVRHGHVIGVIVVFTAVSLRAPIGVWPASAFHAGTVLHYHLDHLGSTQLITNSTGGVVAYIRYKPYGGVRGYYAADGRVHATGTCGAGLSCREFTGYDTEPITGLAYAGARFYDPELGLFLTLDPSRQFPSPYSYGGGDPVNWTDPDGEFFVELLAAALIAAAVSATVNTVIAAAQGASLGQIGQAAAAGAVTGGVGVGLGVVAGGLNIGFAALAGTLPPGFGGMNAALTALGEVAYRSALSTVAANAAGQTASAAGAPGGVVTAVSIISGYTASYGFDQIWLDPRGHLAGLEGKGDLVAVSNTATHENFTLRAAREAGFSDAHGRDIVAANLARDTDLLSNQDHFGVRATGAFRSFAAQARRVLYRGAGSHGPAFRRAIGAASHHLQDTFALGHMFPGTHLLAGPIGAPLRFLIHQTVGGEVTFRQGSYDATLEFFQAMRGLRPS